MESGWRRRRHDECKVLVLFVVLLSFSFSLLRGKSDRLLVLWTGLPPFFFSGLLCLLGAYWNGTLFGKRYMDIYNRSTNCCSCFGPQLDQTSSKHSQKSSLSSVSDFCFEINVQLSIPFVSTGNGQHLVL
jgi:hypothetical protein